MNAAAAFLTERRGRSIHPESLRAKLRGVEGDSIPVDMAELLTEWLQDMGRADAFAWLHAFNNRFGMAAERIEAAPDGGWADEALAVRDKLLKLAAQGGILTTVGIEATADGVICDKDADAIEAHAMEEIRLLFRLARNARRAAQKSRGA
ncbi:hypothetical protein [Kerstersia gyiorum]|uniref:hypothetical protein n=1 Tax=Kerstersia gyiorum TaxID=206506 RepID=UPI0030CDDA9E